MAKFMKKILINKNPWETRAAILRNNKLLNVFFSSHSVKILERSFFKGVVTKVLPGIQTAFVDIGQERSGFLHITEIDRDLALTRMLDTIQLEDSEVKEIKRHTPPDISKIFKEGESVLVQVSKEPIYEKGAKLTTCFTLPGRFIVLMPNIPRIGISKKIEEREEKQRLKDLVKSLLPEGMGAIIRTSSEHVNDKEIAKDVAFLVDTWNSILEKFKEAKNTEKVYEDLPISFQIVRDNLDDDIEEVLIDDKDLQLQVYKFVKGIAPNYSHKIRLWESPPSLFEYYDVEKQIQDALNKKVSLKSGSSIIIESTEAMTVIDVNTGKFIGKGNLEETILQTNLEASEEIVRQLRLRNIGGLIVIDFIDMASGSSRQKLFTFFEQCLKEQDKFQSVVLKVSEFGLLQMTRKRSGKTLIQQLMDTCYTCHGLGVVKTVRTLAYSILIKVKDELKLIKSKNVILLVNPAIFQFLSHIEFNSILSLEKEYGKKITLNSRHDLELSEYKMEAA